MGDVNYKKITVYAILAVIAIIALMYFFNTPKEVRLGINLFIAKLGLDKLFSNLQNSNITAAISDLITKNLTTIIGIGGTAIMAGISYFKYKGELAAKKEALKMVQDVTLENNKTTLTNQEAYKKIQELEQQVKTLNGDTTADTLQARLSSLSGDLETKETTISRLQAQIEELSKQPAQLAEQLWAKSGGQTIDINGVKYKIIEKQSVLVK